MLLDKSISQLNQDLKKRKVKYLVTSTPVIEGRSFGTNVMEAALITLIDKPWQEVTSEDYKTLLKNLDFEPRIEKLN